MVPNGSLVQFSLAHANQFYPLNVSSLSAAHDDLRCSFCHNDNFLPQIDERNTLTVTNH